MWVLSNRLLLTICKIIIVFLFTSRVLPAHAAIRVYTNNRTFETITTLSDAATSQKYANKTIVVTSALSAVQSNISSATLHAWPSDRALRVDKGGSIGNTTRFIITSRFSAGLYKVFAGTGLVKGLQEASAGWFGAISSNQVSDKIINRDAIKKALTASRTVNFSSGTYYVAPFTIKEAPITLTSNQTLQGAGVTTILKLPAGLSGNETPGHFIGGDGVVGRASNGHAEFPCISAVIKNMTIDCSGNVNYNAVGWTAAESTTTENVTVIDAGRSAWVSQQYVHNNRFINSKIVSANKEGGNFSAFNIMGVVGNKDSCTGNVVENVNVDTVDRTAWLMCFIYCRNSYVKNVRVNNSIRGILLEYSDKNRIENIFLPELYSNVAISLVASSRNILSNIYANISNYKGNSFMVDSTSNYNSFDKVFFKSRSSNGLYMKGNSNIISNSKIAAVSEAIYIDASGNNNEIINNILDSKGSRIALILGSHNIFKDNKDGTGSKISVNFLGKDNLIIENQ